jgi:hypothetical protein
MPRDQYEVYIEAANKHIEEFHTAVKEFTFVPREIRFKDCGACKYKTVCRSVYFLNRGSFPDLKFDTDEVGENDAD